MGVTNRIQDFIRSNKISLKFGANEIKEIDYGATRVAFRIQSGPMRGKVIKFARQEDDIRMNKNEVRTWQKAKQNGKDEYFCPIVEYDDSYKWIIMESAKTDISHREWSKFREDIKTEFPDKIIDLVGDNVGRHKGDLKLIDYPWKQF